MIEDMTGIVLAGGRSRRFGVEKALIPWEGKRLIERVIDGLAALMPLVLVLVKRPEAYPFLDRPGVRTLPDLTGEQHPIGGICSGLTYMETEYAFVCACDMPHIRPDLVRALRRECEEYDAVVPVWRDRPQPLCGIYTRRCLGPIEKRIAEGRLKIYEFFGDVRTRYLEEEKVRVIDPLGLSFVDVDTAEDYRRARRAVGGPEGARDD